MAPTKKKAGSAAVAIPSKAARVWSIQQEIVLFRAICRFKPAGQHKHFRMLSIYQMVNNSNVTSDTDGPVSMPEIWEKLATLYNLDGLDELEDTSSFIASEELLEEELENENEKPPGNLLGPRVGDGSYLQDFYLPWKDYGDLIENQALAPETRGDMGDSDSSAAASHKRSSPIPQPDEGNASESEGGDESASEPGSRRTTPTTERPTKRPKVTKKASTPAARITRRKAREEAKSPTPDHDADKAETASEQESAHESSKPTPSRTTRSTRSKPGVAPKTKPTTARRSSRRK